MMSRLPFDPKRMAAAASPASTTVVAASPLTVSQLAVLVNRALRDQLPATIRLVGEISQFRDRTHWYFDLKDAAAVMSCVMFATSARKAGFVPQAGQQVLLSGRIEFYDKGGRTQFMADRMEPIGAGALDLAYRRLCEELRGLGWFEESRKRPLPLWPRRVAVVTSRTGAALQDVLDTARRRCPAIPISLVDVRVQGDGSAAQVARAVQRIGRLHNTLGIDLILITRGGGSMEDLWCFNERMVAEAIVKSPIPVVAAIGHETDTTIAELVADLRSATPTQAAMRIFPDGPALRRQLSSLGDRLSAQVARQIRIERERLRGLSRHPFLADPRTLVAARADDLRSQVRHLAAAARAGVQESRSRLDRVAARLERHRPATVYARREAGLAHAADRLQSAARALVERRAALLQSAARGLDLIGPHSVLRRGYSVTMLGDGRIVRSAADVAPGVRVTTRLADGTFESAVLGSGGTPIREVPLGGARAAAATRRTRTGRQSRDQMDLFGPTR